MSNNSKFQPFADATATLGTVHKTDAKNMENFSVRFLLKIIIYKCIHKFFCVI